MVVLEMIGVSSFGLAGSTAVAANFDYSVNSLDSFDSAFPSDPFNFADSTAFSDL